MPQNAFTIDLYVLATQCNTMSKNLTRNLDPPDKIENSESQTACTNGEKKVEVFSE